MASAEGSTANQIHRRTDLPSNKLLIVDRLRKRKLARSDLHSHQPLVGAFPRALDETDRLPRKLRVHFYSVVFAIISALAYIFDFAADISVAISQFLNCHYVEGVLVLVFAYVPSIFINTLGYLWAMEDLKSRPQNRVTNRLKKPVWIIGLLTQTVPALYSFESAYYNFTFRRLLGVNNGVVDARILELYYWILESDRDSTLLRVFIGFMESAPQLFIQAYILCKFVLIGGQHPAMGLYGKSTFIFFEIPGSRGRALEYFTESIRAYSRDRGCLGTLLWPR